MNRGFPCGARAAIFVAVASALLPACHVSSTVGFNEATLPGGSCSAESAISACRTDPCVVTEIEKGRTGSWAVAVDDALVFFERTPTVLSRVSIRGGPVTDVRTDLDRIWTVAVDQDHVYTTEFEVGVRRVKKSGGPTELVMRPKGTFTALALDRDHVYVTLTSDNQIAMAQKTGGEPTLLAGQATPAAIALDNHHVYWVNQGSQSGATGELVRAPLGDLTHAEILLFGLASPNALAIGVDDVFFASGSRVFQVPKAGGTAQLVEDDFGPVKSMAAHGDTVYLAGEAGLGRARAGAATYVADSRAMLGIAVTCQGVFATGWLESLLVRYSR
jgi:hypothetical protein